MRRHSVAVLQAARDGYRSQLEAVPTPLLSEEDRHDLRPVLRTFAVQRAAFERSRWWWGYHALRAGTAVVAVAVPVVGLTAWLGASRVLGAALVGYLLFGGVAALGHGVQQGRNVAPTVFALGAGVLAVGTAVLAGFTADARYGWLWRGLGVGLGAAVLLLVLAEVRLYGLLAIHGAVFRPLARRRAGWLLPAQQAAVHLVRLLDGLHRARATCRHPRRRGTFLRWMDRLVRYVQWEMPNATRDLRLGSVVTADACARINHLAGRMRRLQLRLVHDHQLQEYDRVCAEVATLTMALARGDWSWVGPEDEVPVRSRLAVRAAKRVIPAALLIGAAIGLRYLPGVTASGASLTGIQLGLGLAAVLSLIPVEAAHREKVMSAFADATKRTS
jgi:hypothetical protein